MNKIKAFFKQWGSLLGAVGALIAIAVILGLLSTCSANEGTLLEMFK